ncbi:MAG TPA: SPOR domain-containing protein [Acidobacteriaceae bacterium]|nr:SPOR domain-containing protein [Acidobacteriaceae bacterium]
MPALFEEDFDVHDPVEVHWSSSTILAIFFAASLVSAVFFGLGYSFGGAGAARHSFSFNSVTANSNAAVPTVQSAKSAPPARSIQPSPIPNLTDNANAHAALGTPPTAPVVLVPVAVTAIAHSPAPVAEKKSLPAPAMVHNDAGSSHKSSAHIMVQIGAIGNRRDADRLVAELRKKGFHAGIYQMKNDKFLHVQIGPFKDLSQAQSKRHQVMASGFHAILKGTS